MLAAEGLIVVAPISMSRLPWAQDNFLSVKLWAQARHAVARPRATGKGRCIGPNFLDHGLADRIYLAPLPLLNARVWWGGLVGRSAAGVQTVQVQVYA